MLISGKDLLQRAHEGGYAVGAFNTNNLEFTKAIIEAAEEMNAPVLVQTSMGAIEYAGHDEMGEMVRLIGEKAKVPVALHLDHGTDLGVVMRCLRKGWTSVMYDGSKLDYDENVRIAKFVVDVAHPMGVGVEAELGKIGGVEEHVSVDEKEATFTDPDEAYDFVTKTGVDSLAIAIGTAHGVYKGEPKLDFERLRIIKEKLNMPIVLHGASGVPDEAIVEAVRLGVNKINIDTELRLAFRAGIKTFMEENPDAFDPRKILGAGIKSIKEVVKNKIRIFGSEGKA